MSTEFRVVWRWKTDSYLSDEFTPQRQRIYKTRRGADRLLALLTKNDGMFEHISDDPNDRGYDGEPTVERWQLDFARLEVRDVGEWHKP